MIFLAEEAPIPGSASRSASEAVLASIPPWGPVPAVALFVSAFSDDVEAADEAEDAEDFVEVVFLEELDDAAFSEEAALEDPPETVTFDLIFEIVDAETPALERSSTDA